MNRLYSRPAPPQSASSCVSCLSTIANRVTSRTASAASKRRLRIANSVTALYTSIFAAAALADARAKGKRRLEWEEKIAAVKEEVNELVDEEQRLLTTLAMRRRRGQPLGVFQTRLYNNKVRPTAQDVQWSRRNTPQRQFHSTTNLDNERDYEVLMELASKNGLSLEDPKEDFDLAIDGEEIPGWLSGDMVRQKVIRKLALKQLAIRFLLRPAIAHNYLGVLKNYEADPSTPQLNVTELITELDALRRRIRQLKTSKDAYIEDLAKDLRVRRIKDMYHERVKLDSQVRHDTELYLKNQMSLEELLLRLANNLLQATDPDRTYTLKMMILAFTKTRQNDLGEMVLKTILPYKFPLSSSLIISIITYFRKSKNLKSFDLFLQMIRGEGYPVDMGNLGFFKRRIVNGVEITVPPVHSTNIVFYAALIKACLRFDQPDRADAYLLSARAAGCMDDFAILMAYLKFYSLRNDWEKGIQVIKRTLAFIASTTEHPLERVERLIVMMVHLCDSCEKFEVSDSIISAAVISGFDWRAAQKQLDISFKADPEFRRWEMAEGPSINEDEEIPVWEKCYTFVNIVGDQLNYITIPEGHGSARRWQKLMGTYSQEVLSAVIAGTPTQYRQQNGAQESDAGDQTPSNFENEELDSHKLVVATQQQEIGALKDEVAQLKQMIFQLYQTTTTPIPPKSSPNDITDLKKRFVPATPGYLKS